MIKITNATYEPMSHTFHMNGIIMLEYENGEYLKQFYLDDTLILDLGDVRDQHFAYTEYETFIEHMMRTDHDMEKSLKVELLDFVAFLVNAREKNIYK